MRRRSAARTDGLPLSLLLLSLSASAVLGGEPPGNPILRIDTGAHSAVINRLAVTRDGALLTVSDDKTARLWRRGGAAPLPIRVPIGPGGEGALYAVAASPTKDSAVVGGFPGLSWDRSGSIYGIDLSTGALTGRLETPLGKIYALAYSADGRYLAIGTDEAPAARVIDLTGRAVVLNDTAYGDAVTALLFLPDGRLVTGSLDGKVRLYDASFHLAASRALANKARPWRIAASPQGDRLAVGTDSPVVHLLSSDGLAPLGQLSAKGNTGGALRAVTWAGTSVFAAGALGNSSENHLVGWDLPSGKETKVTMASDVVSDLAALPDGTIAFATAEPSLGIFDPRSSTTTWLSKRSIADFRDAGDAFKVSADGSTVQFPTQQKGRGIVTFDLTKRALSTDSPGASAMSPPGGPCGLTHWQNSREPAYKGKPIRLQPEELARAAAAAPDCSSVVLGADYSLRLLNPSGVAWTIDLQAPAWAVNLSRDKRFVLAALGDGTIRWYGADGGAEVLSLFATPDHRWITWTREGYFDHGDRSEDLVGYHLNRGKAATPEFVRTGQLYSRFFRPDLVTLKFRGQDLSAAVAQSGGDAPAVVAKHTAPEVALLSWCVQGKCRGMRGEGDGAKAPAAPIDVDTPEVTLRVAVKDRGSGVGNVVVKRNGAAVPTRPAAEGDTPDGHVETHTVGLTPGENHLTVSAFDRQRVVDAGAPVSIAFRYRPPPAAAGVAETGANLPRLHLLAIGINYERDPDNKLKNAVNDATGVADTMTRFRRGLFQQGRVELLTEQQATLANIRASFQRIAAEARPEDVVAVFLAGHGVEVDGKFYFLAYDSTLSVEGAQATGLRHDALVDLVSHLPTTRVAVIIDACHAGAFATPDAALRTSQERAGMNRLLHETGRIILAGSQTQQEALDGVNGHGVFTAVVLTGIAGDADTDRDGKVDVYELVRYAQSNVAAEARKLHHNQNAQFYFAGDEFFMLSAPGAAP